jgi:hypothetical protein
MSGIPSVVGALPAAQAKKDWAFQQPLDGIIAKAEELLPLHQKTSRHLNTVSGLAERDALFVPEALAHCEEAQLAPCGVPDAHPPRRAAGLGEMRHGMQRGLRSKLGCEGMEGWCTSDVRHPF